MLYMIIIQKALHYPNTLVPAGVFWMIESYGLVKCTFLIWNTSFFMYSILKYL